MITNFNNFINEKVDNPFRNDELRTSKGYTPKYVPNLIGIKFKDKEEIDKESGTLIPNYEYIFNKYGSDSEFVKYFEEKYNIKLATYRSGSDDYHLYFECEEGKERETLERLAKDSIVEDVDFVDERGLNNGKEILDIVEELEELGNEYSEYSDTEIETIIIRSIERLKKLL